MNETSSILEFLNIEQECFSNVDNSEIDVESIFEEINRLTDNTDNRSVDEIIREAERLISKQPYVGVVGGSANGNGNVSNGHEILNKNNNKIFTHGNNIKKQSEKDQSNHFKKVIDAVQPDSVLSEESTPKDMKNFTRNVEEDFDDGNGTDTLEEITEGIETIEITTTPHECPLTGKIIDNTGCNTNVSDTTHFQSDALPKAHDQNLQNSGNSVNHVFTDDDENAISTKTASPRVINNSKNVEDDEESETTAEDITLDERDEKVTRKENSGSIDFKSTKFPFCRPCSPKLPPLPSQPKKTYSDKSTNSSPKRCVSAITSPIESISITREYALKYEIDQLQEKLKDTEERLQSLRIQHDSLSHLHRDLRENNAHLQDQSELLNLDVQHLTECANILRSELHSARTDRNDALELQKILQTELEDSRNDKKKIQMKNETDTKVIQDLQRQCREMERILMRKHPDSVSALIVASKHPTKSNEDNSSSRRLLEQRIAQLESDAKEQDIKAQKILANVQARFNSVQSKYETHIADLETQVLSLQEINSKLNAKIESQVRSLDYLAAKKITNSTQTEDIPEKEAKHYSIATQTDAINEGATTSSAVITTRTNTKQSGLKKPSASSKLPSSHSDSTIAAYHAAAKEDAHLLATIRGMRVDLAIKDKAMQRLTRELDECKKTIRKLQKERDVLKSDKPSHSAASSASSTSSRKTYDPSQYTEQASDNQAMKEASNKIKLLEFDYKALHDKRLQDLKTLQTAHERELASCHDTVRILQQRLTERDEAFAMQKRRKVPIDYYALKAKVSSLERRHSEREERLHMLVEALSKGRLNGALEEILNDN